jgi:hypothetical protein
MSAGTVVLIWPYNQAAAKALTESHPDNARATMACQNSPATHQALIGAE